MRTRRMLRLFNSLETTVSLLCVMAFLLLLNIVVPQVQVIGEREFRELAASSTWSHFLLVELGLGHMPTSPLFFVALLVFFLQLALVLVNRTGPTLRRTRLQPRSKEGLEAWAGMEESLSSCLPESWDLGTAAWTLKGYGYRPRRVGDQTLWGTKHRTAPIGFLLFHMSFFLLFGGGIALYCTRFVGTAVLTEGQTFSGDYKELLREPPLGDPPSLSFRVESVDPRFDRGEPTHLGATFRFQQAGSVVEKKAKVNSPARWGAADILVQQAGLAPVLWLQDERGFTRDRVAVAATTRGSETTRVLLDRGRYVALVQPLATGQPFPTRAELRVTPLRLQVLGRTGEEGEVEVLFDGNLHQGEAAALGDGRLVLEELRFWVGIQVVSERGGVLLIAGFVAAVLGLVWRMLLYRREVVLTWDDEVFRLVGRSESYSLRFQEELRSIFSTLRHEGGTAP